jgi:dATP pyrophosphohydrolase
VTPTGRPPKIPRSVLVVIHTPALEVLLIERADKPGYWQSVTGSLDTEDEPLDVTAGAKWPRRPASPAATLRDWQQTNVYEIYPPGATAMHRA